MSGHVTARAALAAIVLSAVAGCSVAAAVPVAEPTPGSTAPIGAVDADPTPVPPVRVTPTPEPTPEPVESKPEPKPEPTQQQQSKPAPKPEPKPTTPPPPPKPDTVTLSPITAIYDQSAIDAGNLVTWNKIYPPCLLAGHDNMGWDWLDDLAVGTVVVVDTGPCAATYEIVDHYWVPPGTEVMTGDDHLRGYDLALQTCVSSGGYGFSLGVRVG